MSRNGFDAFNPAHLPAISAPDVYFAYNNGSLTHDNYNQVKAAHPNAQILTISTDGSLNADDICDCETGDYSPQSAANWAHNKISMGQRPTIYCNRSSYKPVADALGIYHYTFGAGTSGQKGDVDWWAATLDNVTKEVPGAVAVQWTDHGGTYDESVVWDDTWHPAAGPAPTPTPPPPPPAPPTPVPPAHRNTFTPVRVDGIFGGQTVKAQQFVDFNGNLADCDGIFGPNSKKAMQAHLGVAQDGIIGPITVKALQRLIGAVPDGKWGPDTTRHLQSALNLGIY